MMKGVTFDKVIEIIESLPEEQRASLVEIIRNRLIEARRDRRAQGIKKAKKEYARGEVRRGKVDELMRELSK
ncbi:MAG: hypothetical protein QMD05_02785 [Candidatus Brocadiaceae bacterium]|nr:hypothetical protein [Candidatus Brocadiaceae bacterium]